MLLPGADVQRLRQRRQLLAQAATGKDVTTADITKAMQEAQDKMATG